MFHKVCSPGRLGQWFAAAAACMCAMTSGQAFSWPSAALPKIINGEAGFSATPEELSLVVTITFLGNLVMPIPIGYVMDFIGRKNTMMVSILAMIFSWIIIYYSTSAIGLYVARFLAGTWAGVVYTVVPVFIGEVVDPDIRGRIGALFSVSMYFGAMFESLASFGSYSMLAIASIFPPIFLFAFLLFLPESPYFYLLKGKKDKAKASVVWLTGECSDQKLDTIDRALKEQMEKKGKFSDIVKTKGSRKAFIIAESLGVIQRGAGATLLFAYVSIMIPDSFVTASNSFLVLCVVWIFMSFTSSFFMDKYPRRGLLIFSCVGAGLAMLATSVWFYLRDNADIDVTGTEWMPLAFLMVNGVFYSIGIVSIPQVVQGEMFSVNIKAKASALTCILTSIASGVTTYLYLPLTLHVGVYTNFLICAVSSFIGVIFACTYMIETRGKTLEEIQDILDAKKIPGL